MTIFDIIVAALLLWGAYRGFRDGVIVQLGGIVGLLFGIYLAFKFGSAMGSLVAGWIGVDTGVANVVGFILVLIVVILGVALLTKLLSGAFSAMGFGVLDKLGGAILAAVKVGLVVGVLLYSFNYLNSRAHWVEEETTAKSALYAPMVDVTGSLFPYLRFVKVQLLEGVDSIAPSDFPANSLFNSSANGSSDNGAEDSVQSDDEADIAETEAAEREETE